MTPATADLDFAIAPRARAIEEIIAAVSFSFGITVEDVRGPMRTKAVAEARQCVYLVARRCTRLSYPEIAKAVGRDHTTVMSGVKTAERIRESDRWFAATVRVLLERFVEIESVVTQ